MILQRAMAEILNERARQNRLKAEGRFKHTLADIAMSEPAKLTVLAEELGEVARAVQERSGSVHDQNGADLRTELVQLAACCVAWLEALS